MNAADWPSTPRSSSPPAVDPPQQLQRRVRRAWLVLFVAFAVSMLLFGSGVSGAYWVYRHATVARSATLTVETDGIVQVRSPADSDWRFVKSGATVREGDRVATPLGVTATIEMFDGTLVALEQESTVRIERMRDSRFLDRTHLIVLKPENGTLYIAQSPRKEAEVSEVRLEGHDWQVVSIDDAGATAQNRFVLEVLASTPGALPVRIGVFSGKSIATTAAGERHLVEDQQAIIDAAGAFGDVDEITRDMLVNGSFAEGLAAWVPFSSTAGVTKAPNLVEAVRVVADTVRGESTSVVEFAAENGTEPVKVGVRQRIGRSLQVVNSLEVAFDVRISRQGNTLTEPNSDMYPLTVTVHYVDTAGVVQQWQHSWFIDATPEAAIPGAVATRLDVDAWQRVVFDLRNLTPTPQQVVSVELMASGTAFQTRVANVAISIGDGLP